MRYRNRSHGRIESLRGFIVFSLILTTSCNIDAKPENPPEGRTSTLHEKHRDKTATEIWTAVSRRHELEQDNIAFVECLLKELGDDSTVLSKDRQLQLHNSLDLYLEQFAPRFKAGSKHPEKYCYWVAWLISHGIKKAPPDIQKETDIRYSYEDFVDRVILDAHTRLLQEKREVSYARHIETIQFCSTRARETLMSFYSNLHDDFLFFAFDEPISEEIKTYCIERVRKSVDVPLHTGSKNLEFYFREISRWPAYWMTLRTIGIEFYRTKEWGYMSSSATTFNMAPGKWPIDMCFSPDHDANRLETEKREGIREIKRISNPSMRCYKPTIRSLRK